MKMSIFIFEMMILVKICLISQLKRVAFILLKEKLQKVSIDEKLKRIRKKQEHVMKKN